MAMQAAVSSSKVLLIVGAGVSCSIILRNANISELLEQVDKLLKSSNGVDMESIEDKTALLASQIRQLAKEINELRLSSPITVYNRNSASNGNFTSSYLLPAAALGAMGYCYMWWKGWSFSDVMFVTKKNMANAVANVTKQLENLSETLASTKRNLTRRLESLDYKMEEQLETSKIIVNEVDDMRTDLCQIGYDVDMIHQMISGLEGKLELLETKQDATNSGLFYLCQFAGGFKGGLDREIFKDVGAKLSCQPNLTYEDRSPKGLQFIAEAEQLGTADKSADNVAFDLDNFPNEKVKTVKTRIHRTYPVGFSLSSGILGSGM